MSTDDLHEIIEEWIVTTSHVKAGAELREFILRETGGK